MPDEPRFYINDTGTGNTLNLSHPRVIQMVADSLRYWVTETRVDGFRFDLGTILAREPDGFNTESGFPEGRRPRSGARRRQTDRRAVGSVARADIRSAAFLPAGRNGTTGFAMTCETSGGATRRRRHWRPVFALHRTSSTFAAEDLGRASTSSPPTMASPSTTSFPTTTSTTRRTARTTATGTRTTAHGTAARRGRPRTRTIQTLRWRQLRNLLATLILSQGTPMVCAGDEFGRTQNGNNNAYCQDNETSWIHWDMDEERLSLVNFFRRLTAAFHLYPVLRRLRFLTGEMNPDLEVKDVAWIDPNGSEMTEEAWDNGMRCFGMLLDGRGQATGIKKRGADATLLIVFNAHHETVEFTMPPCYEADGWKRLFDTTDPQLDASQLDIGAVYEVTARSMLLFERVPEKTDRQSAEVMRASRLAGQQVRRTAADAATRGEERRQSHPGRGTGRTTAPPAIAPSRSTWAPPLDARGSARSRQRAFGLLRRAHSQKPNPTDLPRWRSADSRRVRKAPAPRAGERAEGRLSPASPGHPANRSSAF